MTKSISEQIEALQTENIRLKNLEKAFDKMVKAEFGIGMKTIQKIVENQCYFKFDFVKKIAEFYDLETDEDYRDYLETFCTSEFIDYYSSKGNPESTN